MTTEFDITRPYTGMEARIFYDAAKQYNPSFEVGAVGVATYWTNSGAGTRTIEAAGGRTGVRCAKSVLTAGQGTDIFTWSMGEALPVIAGRKIGFEAYATATGTAVMGAGDKVWIDVVFQDKDGSTVSHSLTAANITANTTGYGVFRLYGTVPATAVKVSSILLKATSATNALTTLFDDLVIWTECGAAVGCEVSVENDTFPIYGMGSRNPTEIAVGAARFKGKSSAAFFAPDLFRMSVADLEFQFHLTFEDSNRATATRRTFTMTGCKANKWNLAVDASGLAKDGIEWDGITLTQTDGDVI